MGRRDLKTNIAAFPRVNDLCYGIFLPVKIEVTHKTFFLSYYNWPQAHNTLLKNAPLPSKYVLLYNINRIKVTIFFLFKKKSIFSR